ncbi:MAG: carboxymuconolactone decarboxylase family protein [Deferribacterales bacterium]
MALLNLPERDVDNAELQIMFGHIEKAFGELTDNFRMGAISPHMLKQLLERGAYLFKESGINPTVFPAIRYRVACDVNGDFCIKFNSKVLMNAGFTDEDLKAVETGGNAAPLSEADNALVDLSAKAVVTPDEYSAADVERLKGYGYSERQILDAAEHASNLLRIARLLKAFKI